MQGNRHSQECIIIFVYYNRLQRFTQVVTCRLTLSAANESSPEVGSSRNRSLGLPSSSQPMLNRFFSPPLRPLFLVSPAASNIY